MARRRNGIVQKILALHWTFIMLITLMSCIGFAMLYSAAKGNVDPWASRQMMRFMVFFPIMILIALIDIRVWLKYAYSVYAVALLLLIMVQIDFFNVTAMGATRWVKLGPLTIQPSELMKICLVFALARYFHYMSITNVHRVVHLFIPLLIIALPVGLTLLQPDLGTALIITMVGAIMFFIAGVKIWKFIVVGGLGLASLPVVWHFMHDYQKKRVLTFLNPDSDPLGAGYNILQSKIAIGSGGFTGKGFLDGSQSQLSFLPEKQTDFIFTMLAEEFGFLGGIGVMILFAVIIAYGMIISTRSTNHFGRLIAMGMTSVLSLHVFVNIAMVMGAIPVVGAPLPFLSYGGTMLMTVMIACGFILNAHLYEDEELPQDKQSAL